MRRWHDRLAEQGTARRFGTDQPEDDLLGRRPHPTFPRVTPGVPQSFLIHATR